MKKIVALILALIMMLSLAACGGNGNQSNANANANANASSNASGDDNASSDFVKLNLRFATFLTENNPAQTVIDTLQAKLDEKMPGCVKITTYANGTLLGATDIYDGVVNGTCDIGIIQPNLMPGRFPVSMLLEYPGISYNSCEVACRVWTDYLREHDLDEYKDSVPLFGFGSGPSAIFSSKVITDMSDFSGMQIRATSTSAEAIAAYGGTPSTMEFSEVYEAMRSGLVDGCYTNFGAGAVIKLQEVCDNVLIVPLYNSIYTYCMNKDVWNSMPAEQQTLFMEAVDEMCEEYNFVYGDAALLTHPSNIEMKASINITFMEGKLLDDCAAAGAELLSNYAATLDDQGIDGSKIVEELQALADKYNAEFSWEDYKALYKAD